MRPSNQSDDMPGDSGNEDFYRLLFENAAAGIGRTRWEDGRVLIANSRLAEIFGYDDRQQFIDEYLFSEHYPDEDGRQRLLEFYMSHPGELVEATFTRKDGSLVYVEAEVRVDPQQRYIDFVVIDVSDRHAAKDALSRSERDYRTLFENAAVGVGRNWLESGEPIFANQKLAEMFGFDNADQMVREYRFAEHYVEPDSRRYLLDAFKQNSVQISEQTFTRRDGSLITVLSYDRWIEGNDWFDFVAVDITDFKQAIEDRSQAEDLIRTMMEDSPVSLSLKDQQGRYLYVSPAYAHYLGIAADEVIGKRPTDVLSKRMGEKVLDADNIVFDSGKPLTAEDSFAVEVGDAILQVNKFPLRDRAGNVGRIATVGIDITELERTRQALHERTLLLEQSEKIARLGHWRWDLETHQLIYCSRQAAKIFGLTVEEMLTDTPGHDDIQQFIHFEDRDRLDREIRQFWQQISENPNQPRTAHYEYRIQVRDNDIRNIRETADYRIDEDGKGALSIGTVQDLTELTRAREALEEHRDQLEQLVARRTEELEESEQVFRSFYEVIPDISVVTDLNTGVIKSVNQGFVDSTGFERAEIIGRSTIEIDIWDNDKDRERLVEALKDSGMVSNFSADFRKKDGSIWPGIMAACIVQLEGVPHILSTTKDISEQRQIQDMAVEANRAKSDFLSAMSHELRTPLNAILGYAQILQMSQNHGLDNRQQKAFEAIRNSGEHLLQLINRILDLSRIEAGDLELQPEALDPRSIIEESIDMVASALQEKSIFVNNETASGDLPWIYADAIRTRQVLLNLLSNAIRYNRQDGRICIRSSIEENVRLRISISDSGYGFSNVSPERVFEPFDRLGRTQSDSEGAGIGLAISKKLVEAMGGEIGFNSEADSGSRFWFELPLSDTARSELTASAHAGNASTTDAGAAPVRFKRVLYVEDNQINFDLMETIFEEIDNTELLHTENAEDGIELATANPPDLILMDVSLPGMDGIEATRILKQHPETRSIPVIGISAAAMTEDLQRAREVDFYAYQTKPFQLMDFLQTIQSALTDNRH